jgi:hypothetical protein
MTFVINISSQLGMGMGFLELVFSAIKRLKFQTAFDT